MPARRLAALVVGAVLFGTVAGSNAQELTESVRIRLGGTLTRSTVAVNSASGAIGSGFVVDREGRVLTNLHVVSSPQPLEIRYPDGQATPARIVASDAAWDLALLEALTHIRSPPPLRLGDSDRARVGQTVLAVGAPFGLQGTLTLGIISARRSLPLPSGGLMRDVLQTDAAINPGNSGGPLADAQGRVIGVSTAIFSRSGGNQGIGFAVPSNAVRSFLGRFAASADARPNADPRPWIGLEGISFSDARVRGVLVTAVAPGSPAQTAGLVPGAACAVGDQLVIWAIDNRPVHSLEELEAIVVQRQLGTRVTLSLYCGNQFHEALVIVGRRDGAGAK